MRAAHVARRASLVGLAAALLPCASAQAAALSLPHVGVSVPGVGVSVPGVGVSVPSVEVNVPSVEASVPSVEVSLPGVSVSTPGVSASTPSVSASTPSVNEPAPEAPAVGAGETPAGTSSPTGSSPTGSSSPTAPAEASKPEQVHYGDESSSPTAPAASTSASTAASPRGAPAGTRSSSGARRPARSAAPRPKRSRPRGGRPGATGALGGAATAVRRALPSGKPAADRTRASTQRASSPLDTIGGHIPLPLPVPDWSKPIILALLLLAIWFGVRSRVAARRAKRLESQRATLMRDVGAMQAALVPELPARVGALAVSVAYRPAEGPAAGGDFYDVFALERGKVAVILGDVAGHGHEALKQAALTRYTLRAYLQTGLEPRAALALAGRVLADPETEHYATVAAAVYDARDGRLTYASAGHPPPILHGLRTRQPLSLCASPPVGWTVPTGRRQTIVSLPAGAVACFFSDGLVEARRGTDLLGRERLGELLGALGPRPHAAKLLARVKAEASATNDDMAACILMPHAVPVTGETLIEELEADAKMLSTGAASRFLQTCQVPGEEIERTIARARDIAAVFGAALLRAELAPTTAAVAALVPITAGQGVLAERRPRPVGEPTGAR